MYIESLKNEKPLELIESYNDKVQFIDDVRHIYKNSFINFVDDLSKVKIKEIRVNTMKQCIRIE